MRRTLVLLVIVLLSSCATQRMQSELQTTLDSYAAALRWGNFQNALAFVDPAVLEKHPLTKLQLARYAQVRVSGYDVDRTVATSDTTVEQVAQIGLINKNTQSARQIVDKQIWRYDPKAKRWWLESGLPQIVPH